MFPATTSRQRAALLLVVCLLYVPASARADEHGTLEIDVLDGATGKVTPARIEVADWSGGLHVPAEAARAPGRCPDGSEPAWLTELSTGGPSPAVMRIDMRMADAATQGEHVYALEGRIRLDLEPGPYRVRAFKGPEYLPGVDSVALEAGRTTRIQLRLERLIDMRARGWFSADDHIHVVRDDAAVNPVLARWMQAEDVHVANLLEVGSSTGPESARQYAFGKAGLYQQGHTILASGQENPRTSPLGHGIILGASSYIDAPERYLIYREFWAAARRQQALSGFAHWGNGAWALNLPTGNLDFLEILQLSIGRYDNLYLAWDLGYPITPTAGNDYQCWTSIPPGTVRFYTRVRPPLTYAKWLRALDAGRTFVTNGPFLDLRVDRASIGGRLALRSPRRVKIRAEARFDPARDAVEALELVRNGEVVGSVEMPRAPGRLRLRTAPIVSETSWFAVRTRGEKVAERFPNGVRQASVAHTGAIVIEVAGSAGPSWLQRRAAERALDAIDDVDASLEFLHLWPTVPEEFTGIDATTMQRGWPALQAEIEAGRRHFRAQAQDGP